MFVRVVDAGTFTHAADSMRMPKATLTRMVQALEKELGVKLLHRTTRRLSVTQEGAMYYKGAVRLIEELEMLNQDVASASTAPAGRITVEAPGAIAYSLLVPNLPDFFSRYPQVQIDLRVGNRTIDLIAENVDCVIRIGPIVNEMLVARSLRALPMMISASNVYLAQRGIPASPEDIARDHTLVQVVSPTTGRNFNHTLQCGGVNAVLDGRHQITVNDSTAALMAAVAGLGIVATYSFIVQPYLDSGSVRRVLPEWHVEAIPTHIAYPMNRHMPSKLRVFVDWVDELFQQF